MNNNTKKIKDSQVHFRADEEFSNELNNFIASHLLKKSEFIREAVSKEMKRINEGNYDALLSDNSLYNFVVRKSAKHPAYKKLINEFERSLSK